jgi:glycosyltransferase involved in cell wall biosynthesis
MSSAVQPNIIVGIPAYNEGDTIAAVVSGSARYATTVVVVDDGSGDLTSYRALRAGAVVIRHTGNGGKGAAVATLFRHAVQLQADALVLIDGDGQHDPGEIPTVVAPCLDGTADVVVGSRYLSQRSAVPVHRTLGQRAFNVMTTLASGIPCSDSQSGFRAFNRRAICAMRIAESTFSVECEQQFECQAHGLRLREAPISCRYDLAEKRSAYVQGVLVLSRLVAIALDRRILRKTPVSIEHAGRVLAPASALAELDAATAMGAD